MDNPLSRGLPFDLSDIWRQSAFQPELKSDSLFLTDLPEFELIDVNRLKQQDFRIPELREANGIEGWALESIESEVATPSSTPIAFEAPSVEVAPDVWTLNFDIDDQPRLRTWEAFERKDVPNAEYTAYLSEAGPEVFDAALIHLEARPADSGVLPQDVMVRALCNLVLGRSSLFFPWDPDKKAFVSTLPKVPLSGYSSAASSSFLASVIDYGSSYRYLDEFASATLPVNHSCTAKVAFEGCVTSILGSIERYITRSITQIDSLLQLQRLVERPHQLLNAVRKLVGSVENYNTDEHIIPALSDCVHHITAAETHYSEILNTFLARVSAPWLEQLCKDLGLVDGQVDYGLSRPGAGGEDDPENVNTSFDEHTQQTDDLRMFVNNDDRALIQQTKASIKILRQYLPDECIAVSRSMKSHYATLIHDNSAATRNSVAVNFDILEAPATLSAVYRIDNTSICLGAAESSFEVECTEHLAWSDQDVQHDYLAACDARISQPLEFSRESLDPLQKAMTYALNNDASQAEGLAPPLYTVFNPVERLRPLIWTQSKQVNKTLLRHLFSNCRLRRHVDLQRQYHLLGNGDFVTRLSTALFSTETQPAERKRGTIPTGETIGLRLGARDGQRWPPASSELRLTLMGVLLETYHPEFAHTARTRDVKELPGGLSFSIRELPDKDIERVLDPSSIYALDFLRLQYNAPPCLDAILAPSSMQAYDSIFRFLLRMVRMLHVTNMLRDKLGPSLERERKAVRHTKTPFMARAHHLVTTLMSHFMDIGIEAPWGSFISSLTEVERGLDSDDNNIEPLGLDGLRKLHETCLGSIRSRLFLRRKQERIRNAIESVFTAILKCASTLENGEADTLIIDLASFHRSMTELLGLLRAAVDRAPKADADFEAAQSDTEAMKMLLIRLDWNNFYSDAS